MKAVIEEMINRCESCLKSARHEFSVGHLTNVAQHVVEASGYLAMAMCGIDTAQLSYRLFGEGND